MKLSVRERWLCVAMPAVLTVLLCEGHVVRRIGRETAGLRAAVAGREPVAVLTARLGPARAEGERLAAELTPLRAQVAAEMPTDRRADRSPADALRGVARLCERRGVTLLDAAPSGAVSAALPRGPTAVWRLHLRGAYPNVQGLIEDLSASDTAMPAGINMEPADDDGKPGYWVLTVWTYEETP
jgi:hypothetical protein